MNSHDALGAPVERFVNLVAAALGELAVRAGDRSRPDRLRDDAVTEAGELVAGFVDADARHSDEELWAYIRALGPLLDTHLGYATPADIRAAGIVAGRRAFLDQPSPLFELLVDADARDRGARSWAYYRAAMDLAHAVASLDVHTSQAELDAIARFRALLLERIGHAGVQRPDAAFFDTTSPAPAPDRQTPVAGHGAQAAAAAGAVAPAARARPVEELLADLDQLVGLAPVKAEVRLVANLLIVQRLREHRGLPTVGGSRHLVFTGNPGTGKTTVARLLAQIYRSLGVVDRGHLVEVDRSGLVAGFVGQTATRTRAVCESALDGVLLIDEAHALARGSEQDFGRESIDTLVKVMEDERDRLVVIVAGYPQPMAAFLTANAGLASRFPKTLHFPDYSAQELVDILELMADDACYELTPAARLRAFELFDAAPRGPGFGNARLTRNLFEAAVVRHASRVVAVVQPTRRQLIRLEVDDIVADDLGVTPLAAAAGDVDVGGRPAR